MSWDEYEKTPQEQTNNSAEADLFDRINAPISKVTEEIIIPNDNADFDNVETEQKELTPEEKIRFKNLNKLGAKGIVKAMDLGMANLAAGIAMNKKPLRYRADPEAIQDIEEVVEEIIPKASGKELKIPVWMQLLLFIAIAFLPVIIAAITDRRQYKEVAKYKKEIRKLKYEKHVFECMKERDALEQELKENAEQENLKVVK